MSIVLPGPEGAEDTGAPAAQSEADWLLLLLFVVIRVDDLSVLSEGVCVGRLLTTTAAYETGNCEGATGTEGVVLLLPALLVVGLVVIL